MAKSSGCAPLAISFANTTSGASANASFEWNFGNGNTSLLKDPGAVFLDARSYTVTLIVKDSNKTSSVAQNVTVYKKPVVDFTASLQKGCFPLPVEFTANASAGDGMIAQYLWDFGDGFTEQVNTSTVTHTYVAKQNPVINLSVTNSYGCQATIVRENVITVLEELKASFATEKKILCTINEAANFINTTTGPGILSYSWDFGDGQASTVKQPSHIYTAKGTYAVKLTVSSSEGCKDTLLQNESLNVANYKTDWETTGLLCEENTIKFINKSTPAPDQSQWDFNNGYPQNTTNINVETWYPVAGTYNVKLTNTFGSCTDVLNKQIIVQDIPQLTGFITEISGVCGSPVKVNFKDTTAGAVKWEWRADYHIFNSTLKEPSTEFTYDYDWYVYLKVFNDKGCSNTTSKYLVIRKPFVKINSPDVSGNGSINSCGPKTASFFTTSSVDIATYQWNFGDGSSSTDAKPVHNYSKEGDYRVSLSYTTVTGCGGTVEFEGYVSIRDQVKADFTVTDNDICGNTPFTISSNVTAPYYYHNWDMGDGVLKLNEGHPKEMLYKYEKDGIYTIRLIINNLFCTDTVVKTNYIKVSPPFPKIAGFTNTCEGTRGTVTFSQTSKQSTSWHWDFGDGTTLSLNTDQPEVKHTYTKTGWYKVVLNTTNGACTVGDSVFVNVLLKQHPVLTGDKTIVCRSEDYLTITVSNLEQNPAYYSHYGYGYSDWEHRNGSYAPGHVSAGSLSDMPFSHTLWDFTPGAGRQDLRLVVTSNYFGCRDTTNWIPLKINGPIPGFKQIINNPCANGSLVTLRDTSKSSDNVALKSWEWNFSDGATQTTSTPTVTHTYGWPGTYPVYLTVTDINGCYANYQGYANAENNNLHADFSASATTISPGTTINFSNTSTTSDIDHTSYQWLPGDGSQITTFDAVKTYTQPGVYTVRLIAKNTLNGCADTASVVITVKYINAAFKIDQAYTSISQCPPVLVKFTNLSYNISKITWDFGDGTIVSDVFNPSHIYTKAGKYKIILVTESDNGTQYTTEDSVIIKAPSATMAADILHSCTSQTITLNTIAKNGVDYLWDFGDGTIIQVNDTFATHRFQSAGIYEPKLIVTDLNGCAAPVDLADKIVIDSLSISLNNLPSTICSPKEVLLNPTIVSVAANQGQQSLTYHWNFGTGISKDTSDIQTPSFVYQQPGTYNVKLTVRSPYGCLKETTHSVVAYQGLGGRINGPASICEETTAQFSGATLIPGQPKWEWIFHDGSVVKQQNPSAKLYDSPGNYSVKLLVDNNGCVDTLTQMLQVNAKPDIILSAKELLLCQGSQQTITASGGSTYAWSPATGLNTTAGAEVTASPLNNIVYTVAVTNANGCKNTDSVSLTVAYPFTLQLDKEAKICSGKSIELNASGADNYQWIQNTSGLSSTQIANPVATPAASTIYTVSATDIHHCFTRTASINIIVQPLPTVDAGPGAELFGGAAYQIKPTASNDVLNWIWSPAKYLSCTDCPSPVSKPLEPMIYTVTVANATGCTASDTVTIKMLCDKSKIYVPAAFTPNNDGLNDRFMLKGSGIKQVKYLRIYNRWGELVFERNNFQMNDAGSAWDGTHRGLKVPGGAYIFMAEMTCNNEVFTEKGTVTVIY